MPSDIRSFKARQGRISTLTRAGLDDGADLLLPSDVPLAQAWPSSAAGVVLEIGSGFGEAVLATARSRPDVAFLAAEVHTRGVSRLLRAVVDDGLTMVRVLHGDVVPYLRDQVSDRALTTVRVFFPDPWPKAKHAKRRLLQRPFLDLLADRLVDGGRLLVATDDATYAGQVLDLLREHPALRLEPDGFAPRPVERPPTRYEAIALEAGRTVRDLVAERRPR